MNAKGFSSQPAGALHDAESIASLPPVCLELAAPQVDGVSVHPVCSEAEGLCAENVGPRAPSGEAGDASVAFETWLRVERLFIHFGEQLLRGSNHPTDVPPSSSKEASLEVSAPKYAAAAEGEGGEAFPSRASCGGAGSLIDGISLDALKSDPLLLPEGILTPDNVPLPLPSFSPRRILEAQRIEHRLQLASSLGELTQRLSPDEVRGFLSTGGTSQASSEALEGSGSFVQEELTDAPSVLAQILSWRNEEVRRIFSCPCDRRRGDGEGAFQRSAFRGSLLFATLQTRALQEPLGGEHKVPPSLLPQWLEFEPRKKLPTQRVRCEAFDIQLKNLHSRFDALSVSPPPSQLRLPAPVASAHAARIRWLEKRVSSEESAEQTALDNAPADAPSSWWRAVCSYLRFYLMSGVRSPQASEVIAWGCGRALEFFNEKEGLKCGTVERAAAKGGVQGVSFAATGIPWLVGNEAFPLSEFQLECSMARLSPLRITRAVFALRNSRFERSLALQNIETHCCLPGRGGADSQGPDGIAAVESGSLVVGVCVFGGERPQNCIANLEFLTSQTLFDLRQALRGLCSAETTSAGVGGVSVSGSCFLLGGVLYYEASCPTSKAQYALPLRRHFWGEGRLARDAAGEEGPLVAQEAAPFASLEIVVGEASGFFLHAGSCAHRVLFTGLREFDALRDPKTRSGFPLRLLSPAVKPQTCHVCREASATRAVANSILCSVVNPTVFCAECWGQLASSIATPDGGKVFTPWREGDPYAQSFSLFDGGTEPPPTGR